MEHRPADRLLAQAGRWHAVAFGVEHPMRAARVQRGKMRALAHEALGRVGLEAALAALRRFYTDRYWLARGCPFAAYARNVVRLASDARRSERGTRAEQDADAEFERDLRAFGRRGGGGREEGGGGDGAGR